MDAMDWVHCRSPSIGPQNGILCADDLTIKVQRIVPLELSIKDTQEDQFRRTKVKPKETRGSLFQNSKFDPLFYRYFGSTFATFCTWSMSPTREGGLNHFCSKTP